MYTKHLIALKKLLEKQGVLTQLHEQEITFGSGSKSLIFQIAGEGFDFDRHTGETILPLDQIVREPQKITALILSKLGLNQTVFARSCEVKRVDKKQAAEFLDFYHIMNSTQSAYNFGLFNQNELIALASFSKGRKMNRLEEHQRSFELIRFCCRTGITVTGGLTRLIKNFCNEKQAGDIMTYVDKQLSDGTSFVRAGFKKHSETEPNYFLVNRETFERIPANEDTAYDAALFYLSRNSGNIKLVYTPIQK